MLPLACRGPRGPDPPALPAEKYQSYIGWEYLIFLCFQSGPGARGPGSHFSCRPSGSASEELCPQCQEPGQPKGSQINEAERASFPKTSCLSRTEMPSTWPVGSLCQDSLCVFINWPYLHQGKRLCSCYVPAVTEDTKTVCRFKTSH